MLEGVKKALRRLPLFGYALHWAADLATLPLMRLHLKRDIQHLQAALADSNDHLLHELAELRATVTRLSEGQQSTLPSAVYLGDHRLLIQTWQGLPLICDSRDLQITPKLVTTRRWEPNLTAVFQRLMLRGSRYLEAGGHVGYFALLAAALSGPEGWVEVYEPNPTNFRFLSENIRINHLTSTARLHPLALSNENACRPLHVFTSNSGSSSLAQLPEPVLATFGERPTAVDIQTVRLDDQYGPHDRFDFFKLDVEGAEDLVFQGGIHFLQRCLTHQTVIALEYNPQAAQGLGLSPTAALDRLSALGFSVVILTEDGTLHPYPGFPLHGLLYADVLARPNPWPRTVLEL